MLKKLKWLWILIIVLFLLIVFKAPGLSDSISWGLWFPNLNTNIRNFKKTLDEIVTRVPSKDEVTNWYSKAYSWAVEFKDNFEKWVKVTKEKIDTVRKTLSWAEDTYTKAKETFDETKELIENTSEKLNDIKETVDKVSEVAESLQGWTWSTK